MLIGGAACTNQPTDIASGTGSKDTSGPTAEPTGKVKIDYDSPALRQALDRGEPAFLLPVELPPGASEEVPFLVAGDPIVEGTPANRTWWSHFTADSLPPAEGSITGYSVFQVAADDRPPTCGSGEEIVREIASSVVRICLGPRPTVKAKRYWAHVEFSSQPGEIGWLNLDGDAK